MADAVFGLADRLKIVQTRVAYAALRSGRLPEDVRIITVTKYIGVAEIHALIQCGIMDIGENRVQDAWKKYQAIEDRVKWHMIGHLQRNKAHIVAKFCAMVHSVCDMAVAEALDRAAEKCGRKIDVLVQVNVSGETTKQGIHPSEVATFVKSLAMCTSLVFRGFMTMAPLSENPEASRPYFRRLRDVRDAIVPGFSPHKGGLHLSMGMSNDYEVAIEEGATMVRIGRDIVG